MHQLLQAAFLASLALGTGCRTTEHQPEETPAAPPAEAPMKSVARPEPFSDFNGNGVEDSEDISNGTSLDEDANGIPDEAEDC